MTFDWFVLLAPLLLAALALPFLFLGCGSFAASEEAPPQPGDPPATGAVKPETFFQLNLDSTLQALFPGATSTGRVVEATIAFNVFEAAAPTVSPIALGPTVLRTTKVPAPSPPELDPATDGPATFRVLTTDIVKQDKVTCTAQVKLAGGATFTAIPAIADVAKGFQHIFRLVPAVNPAQPSQRAFKVVFERKDGT
jgi:hypothetical protein